VRIKVLRMARPATYLEPRRVNILLERKLHLKASRLAFRLGLRGGFSEYVARLIAADRRGKRKTSAGAAAKPKRDHLIAASV